MKIAVPGAPRRSRSVPGLVAVAAASLAIAGCGGGETSSGAGVSTVAGFIPAGSPIYVEVSTDASGPQWTQALALAKRFPGYKDLEKGFTEGLAGENIDFATQIKPVLGSTAAIGVFDFNGLGDDDADPSVVAAVDIADGKHAEAVTLLTSGSDRLTKNGQVEGVDLYTGDDDTVAAVVDGTALFSDTKENIAKAIQAHKGGDSKSMAGSDRLKEAFGELPDEVLAQGFIDVGTMIKLASQKEGGKEAADQLANAGLGEDAAVGMSISAEEDGVRFKAVGTGLGDAAKTGEVFTPQLTNQTPADAIAYIGLRNIYGTLEQGLKQARGRDPEVDQALSQASVVLPLLGITLDDVKGLTSLEHAFIVTKGEKPGVVAALEVADGAGASKTLDKLRTAAPALASQAGTNVPPFEEVDLANGVKGWQSPISEDAGVVYGVDGKLAFIGTLVDAVKQVQAPSSKLSDDPAYQAATRQMPSKVSGVVWLNVESLLTTLDGLGLLKDAPADTIANIRPIKNLAAWGTSGDKPTFEAFVTIK